MPSYKIIEQSPKYKELVLRRRRLSFSLSALMMIIYFGFLFLVAYARGFLGEHLEGRVMTVGVPIGVTVILAAFVLTGIYVYNANVKLDPLTRDIVKEAGQ